MKKNAFTLIETLAVIIIIGLFALITVPVIDSNLKKSREVTYKVQIEEIKEAAKNWASDNLNLLPNDVNNQVSVSVCELINGGYIPTEIKNPKNANQCVDSTNNVTISLNNINGGYTYSLLSENLTWNSCEEVKNSVAQGCE